MIYRYLGEQIDIHGGGNDLIFPHHENEILQTEAVTGKPLANYWMHNGMLQVKGHGMSKEEKMSKSLGNFFTVKDVLAKYDTRTVRFYFLNTHYMSPLVYGEDMLIEAGAALGRLTNNYRELQAYVRDAPEGAADGDAIASYRNRFREAMDNDFNTREAIGVMFEMASESNRAMSEGTMTASTAREWMSLIAEFDTVLGIMPQDGETGEEDVRPRRHDPRPRQGCRVLPGGFGGGRQMEEALRRKAVLTLGGAVRLPEGFEPPCRISHSTAGPGAGFGSAVFAFDGYRVKKTVSRESGEFELVVGKRGRLSLTRRGRQFIPRVEIVPVVRHCPEQAFFNLDPRCMYRCAFCNSPLLDPSEDKHLSTERIMEMLEESLSSSEVRAVSLTSGVVGDVGSTVDRFVDVIRAVRSRCPDMPIGVEPYVSSREHIERLREAGADEIKLNLESPSREVFSRACPDLDMDSIWSLLSDAVDVFGRGRVVSNIIYGMGETDADLDVAMERMCRMGVLPGLRALRVNDINRVHGGRHQVRADHPREGGEAGRDAEGGHEEARADHRDLGDDVPGVRMLRPGALQGLLMTDGAYDYVQTFLK